MVAKDSANLANFGETSGNVNYAVDNYSVLTYCFQSIYRAEATELEMDLEDES